MKVHAADIQDGESAVGILAAIGNLYPGLRHVLVGGGCAGDELRDALVEVGEVRIAPLLAIH
ncbi:MAG: hypothetical protein JSU72_07145 [Deltaproteobacteria bacterium]|nr:MAG: hypothetical protein JSU72_07145 [Deltaproteobacteria bacterium]